MKKNILKTLIKYGLVFFAILVLICLAIFAFYYVKINSEYNNLTFDKDKLVMATSYAEILDSDDNVMSNASINGRKTISIEELPKYTVDAFVAIEDQDFYKHHGLNYKRMIKAILVNIKSGYAKEGASTISQQLIKNTHLNNEKTIERKLKEIFLTRKLEKSFTKNEIMETYLNVIYFGNSCFGIESASEYYFDKNASDLTIAESALLAGLIKSPKLYSPILNPNASLNRRNLVISQMLQCGYITSVQATQAKNEQISIVSNIANNSIDALTLEFATQNLNLSEKDVVTSNLKIKTYIDTKLQSYIDNLNLDLLKYDNIMPEYAIIVENNNSGGIVGIKTSPNINIATMLRQPASCIKPFLVYAPNFEDGKISLLTKIDDEKVNINGFAPHNAGNKYKGNINVREAISTSSNVCATKLLNYYGISKAKNVAEKFGFRFNEKDNHLALALGSLYDGCNLLTLTNAYSALSNGGRLNDINIISSIKNSNNNLSLFKKAENSKQVISEETAFLITQALQTCSKTGTAKKLNKYSNFVAAKTGTNGANNSDRNTDAYCISYSKDYTVCVWMGVKDANSTLLPKTHNGGNQPSAISKQIWDYLNPSKTFGIPSGIEKLRIDKHCYDESGTIKLATQDTLDRYVIQDYFNKKYAPKLYAETFTQISLPDLKVTVNENHAIIDISNLDEFASYSLYRKCGDKTTLLKKFSESKNNVNYIDENLAPDFYEYFVVVEKERSDSKQTKTIKVLVE